LWWRRSQDGRLVAFATLWFLLVLAPALNLHAFPYGEAAHDRYLYLPSVGFGILVAIGLRHITSRTGWSASRFAVVAVALAAPLAAMAFSQQVFWASDMLVYRRGVAVAPANNTVRNNLGRAIADTGRYDEAESVLTDLVRTAPGNWQAHYNLGYVYYRTNRFADAEAQLKCAIEIYSRYAAVHLYLGLTQFRLGKLDSADRELRAAIALAPDRSGAHLALSLVLEAEGDLNGALAEVRQEMKYSREDVHIRAREEQLARKVSIAPPVK
jgi:tetratricopeptide (TPR) repeat protein